MAGLDPAAWDTGSWADIAGTFAGRWGEWAMVAGLMSDSDARSLTGIPVLSQLPLIGKAMRDNERNRIKTDVILLLRPVLLDAPPDPSLARRLWLGSETRNEIPL